VLTTARVLSKAVDKRKITELILLKAVDDRRQKNNRMNGSVKSC
jgi:hypothetical protein